MFEGGGAAIEPITLPGGQLMITTEVENYPGLPQGHQGPELMELFKEQAERFGTTVVHRRRDARSTSSTRPFRLVATERRADTRTTLIIATGASAKWLGHPVGGRSSRGYGVSACATCDGALLQGQGAGGRRRRRHGDGGGDVPDPVRAKVTLVHRRDEFRASKIMLERARRNPKIELVTERRSSTRSWATAAGRASPACGCATRETGDARARRCGGVFVAIGHEPNTKLFQGQLDMDEAATSRCSPARRATKIPGVFACGDVADHVYRQAVTAAGTGCMAAIDAERFLAH